jgi:CBS domain-containing protein
MTRISDVMSTGLVTIGRSTTVREAAGLMVRHGVGALLVMEGSPLVGIFTERDISRAVMRDVDRSRSVISGGTMDDPSPDDCLPADDRGSCP